MFSIFKKKAIVAPSLLAEEERKKNADLISKSHVQEKVFDWKSDKPDVMADPIVWGRFLETLSLEVRRGMSLAKVLNEKEYLESLAKVYFKKREGGFGAHHVFGWKSDSAKKTFYRICT